MKSFALVLFLTAGSAFGQAWTPPAGNTSVLFTLQTSHLDSHSNYAGELQHNVDMRPRMLALSIDHGVTDRLAFSFSTAYVESRYRGAARPHPGLADNGEKHGTLQDLTVHVRYAALQDPVAVVPFLRVTWPSRNYSTLGHSAAGRGLQEQEAGVSVGYEILASHPIAMSASYGYTRVEKVEEHISTNRSTVDAQLGMLVTPRLFVRIFGTDVRTHGGLTLPLSPAESAEHFHHHDQLLRANSTRAGAGVSFSVTSTVDVHASFGTTIRSSSSHAGRSFAIGAGWNFDARKLLARFRSASSVAAMSHMPNRDAIF